MSADLLRQYAVGGAQRPDSFSGMQPQLASALAQLFASAPPEIQQNLRVTSGYRSPQRQAELYQQALKKYGSPQAARRWVAPPGRSQHNHGGAADLKYLNPVAQKWAHENAAKYGLAFPLGNENWHVELAGARGGHKHNHGGGQMMAQGGLPSPLQALTAPAGPAAAFNSLGGPTVPQPPAPPQAPGTPPNFGDIAATYLAQRGQRVREQEDQAAAEQARKLALLNSVAPLYG